MLRTSSLLSVAHGRRARLISVGERWTIIDTMASLEHRRTGRPHILGSVHTVGRGSDCDLYLNSDLVSWQHAIFRWGEQGWEVRDLGSANGTWLDDCRLEAGVWQALDRGASIAFGTRAEVFEVVDVAAPVVVARSVEPACGAVVYGDDAGLVLPDVGEPRYLIQDDGNGRWFVHGLREDSERPITDREILVADGRSWRISLPLVPERTRKPGDTSKRLGDIGLRFRVSPDEEHVAVAVVHAGGELPLPDRAWDYFLLTLARARLADADRPGLAASEHGWMHAPTLADGLDVSVTTIRAYVHRARRQMADVAGVIGADRLIERRRGNQAMRIGVARLEVQRSG